MRGLRNRGIERDRTARGLNTSVALITLNDGVNGIKNRDVDNGHCAARASRPKLFSEYPSLAGRDRRVVEAASIDGDFIPPMNRIELLPRSAWLRDVTGIETRSERFIEAFSASVRERAKAKSEGKDKCRWCFQATRFSAATSDFVLIANGRNGTAIRKENQSGWTLSDKVRSSVHDCRSCHATFQLANFFQEKLESCPTLLAPQRHNDLLVTTGKNNAPILNGLELDLIILRARLQAELLAFLHGFAVDYREVRSQVEGDRSKEEGG